MTPATLTMTSWSGRPIEIGQYLVAKRGRTAYLVIRVRRSRPGSKSWGRVDCVRTPVAELPAGADVRGFYWNSRG